MSRDDQRRMEVTASRKHVQRLVVGAKRPPRRGRTARTGRSRTTRGPAVPTRAHAPYYGGEDNPYEAIKVIEAWDLNFNLGSVLKYIARHGKKPGADVIHDLRKAAWYCEREANRLEHAK